MVFFFSSGEFLVFFLKRYYYFVLEPPWQMVKRKQDQVNTSCCVIPTYALAAFLTCKECESMLLTCKQWSAPFQILRDHRFRWDNDSLLTIKHNKTRLHSVRIFNWLRPGKFTEDAIKMLETIPFVVEFNLVYSTFIHINYPVPIFNMLPGILTRLTKLELGAGFNRCLLPGSLPQNITELVFGDYFNQPISVGVLPQSLHSIRFKFRFDQVLEPGVLPQQLETLRLGARFNQLLSIGSLPSSLTDLTLGYDFDNPIEKSVLPLGLRSLRTSEHFNQPLGKDVLPSTLTFLTIECMFAEGIFTEPSVLPSSLTHLIWRSRFVLLDFALLPHSVTDLTIPRWFKNRSMLPPNLTRLIFSDVSSQIAHALPPFPPSITALTMSDSFNDILYPDMLPIALQTLVFGRDFNQSVGPDILPSTLTTLKFSEYFSQTVSWPPNLKNLYISSCYSRSKIPLSCKVIPV